MTALWKDVLEALESALPIIQFDAQMMADITRHAPLDPESQAKHDSTEYASEHLVRTIPPLIERLKAALAEPQPEPLTPEQRAVISPAALRRYDEACKAAPQAQKTQTAANSKSRLKRLSALGAPLCSGCGNEIG